MNCSRAMDRISGSFLLTRLLQKRYLPCVVCRVLNHAVQQDVESLCFPRRCALLQTFFRKLQNCLFQGIDFSLQR